MSFPSGLELDGVLQYYSETVQSQELGQRGFMPDGRAYRYVQTEADALSSGQTKYGWCVGRGLLSYNPDDAITSSITTAGSRIVTGTNTNNVVADQLKGGILTTYDTTGRYFSSIITANTAANNAAISITLERPSIVTSSGNDMRCCASNYHQVVNMDPDRDAVNLFEFVAGVCNSHETKGGVTLAEDHFLWVQTWGACNCMIASKEEGEFGCERMCYFTGAGTVQTFPWGYATDDYQHSQMAGYLMVATNAIPGISNTGTDVNLAVGNWVWLMITP